MNEMQSHRSRRRRAGIEEKRVGDAAVLSRPGGGDSQNNEGRLRTLQQPDAAGSDTRRRFDGAAFAGRSLARRVMIARRLGLRRGMHRVVVVHAVMRRRLTVPVPGTGMLRLMPLSHSTRVLHQRQAAAQEHQHGHQGRRQAKSAKRGEHDSSKSFRRASWCNDGVSRGFLRPAPAPHSRRL